jgi:hypothetical protein
MQLLVELVRKLQVSAPAFVKNFLLACGQQLTAGEQTLNRVVEQDRQFCEIMFYKNKALTQMLCQKSWEANMANKKKFLRILGAALALLMSALLFNGCATGIRLFCSKGGSCSYASKCSNSSCTGNYSTTGNCSCP